MQYTVMSKQGDQGAMPPTFKSVWGGGAEKLWSSDKFANISKHFPKKQLTPMHLFFASGITAMSD